ncbi:hypothetical protein ACVW19_006136 [Streptomyces sp. TE5632]
MRVSRSLGPNPTGTWEHGGSTTSTSSADLTIGTGVFIGTGPHEHAIRQTFFLQGCEPGGNHVELCNPYPRHTVGRRTALHVR